MKLLWLSHFIPYPPRGGAHQRSFNLIRHMSHKAEISLVALNQEGHARDLLSAYESELRKCCGEVIVWELPYRWRGLHWWMRLGLSPLDRYPMGCRGRWSKALGIEWQKILESHRDSVIHFDSIDLALYAPPTKGFKKILNHHNCESAMVKRRAELERNPLKRRLLASETVKIEELERRLCAEFDVNITVSDLDTEHLKSRAPSAQFHVVENGTDTRYFFPSDTPPEPNSLVFAGSLGWYPNLSAIRYFDAEIWPLIRKRRPNVKFYIAGQTPSQGLMSWGQSNPHVTLVPNPEDIRPWIARGAVFVCPIIDGGGTKLKLLDAMAMGKAIVSTGVACEGLSVTNGENILVADTPQDFADKVLNVLENEELRKRLAANGRAMVERTYSWDAVGLHLEQAIQQALGAGEKPA